MQTTLKESFAQAVDLMKDVASRAANGVANFVDRERKARIEADLDRRAEELRRTILQLADALGVEAHEARKTLIRESFIASGKLPDEH